MGAWEDEAAKMNPTGKPAAAASAPPAASNDDWKIWQTGNDASTPQKSAPLRFVQSFNEGFGIPVSVQDKPSEGAQGIKLAIQHPSLLLDSLKEMGKGFLRNQDAAAEQGKTEWKNGHPIVGAVHMAESGIPFIGPALVNADNKLASGDTAGALGAVASSALQAASMHPKAPEMAANAGRAAMEVPHAVGEAAKNKSYSMYDNVLGTKGRNGAFGASPGRGVAAEGVWGGKKSLLNGIQDAIAERGAQKSQVLNLPQNAIKRFDYGPAISDPFVEELNNGVRGTTSDATLGRLRKTMGELTQERSFGPDGEIEYGGQKNLTLSPAEADALKTNIYERTNYRNPDLDESVNNTLRRSGHNVKDAIEVRVPEVKPFNRRLSDLYGAKTALSSIINNRMVSPTRSGFTEVGPAVLGAATGGPIGAGAAVASREIARMPAVRTGAAQAFYRMGNFLSPGEELRVPQPQAAWLNIPTPKALPSGPVMVGPSTQAHSIPVQPVAPTTRAQRLNLLLPEKAGGKIPQQGTPVDSDLWNELQKKGERP